MKIKCDSNRRELCSQSYEGNKRKTKDISEKFQEVMK